MSELVSEQSYGAPKIEIWHMPDGRLVLASIDGKMSRECRDAKGSRLGAIDFVAIQPDAALTTKDLLDGILRQQLVEQDQLKKRIRDLDKKHSEIKLI